MRKFLLLVISLCFVAFAQRASDPMPVESPQYSVSQQLISSIHGYEEACAELTGERAKEAQKRLWSQYRVIQAFCGGYIADASVPLEEIDRHMVQYEAVMPWQKFGTTYARLFKFGRGELLINLLEFDDSASLLVSYREPKD